MPDARASSQGAAAGHSALLLVQLVFGLFPALGLLAMDEEVGFRPMTVAAWRIGGGTLVFGVLASLRYRGSMAPRRGDLGRLVLLALLGIVANQGLYLTGLARSNATNAGLVICTVPVFTFTVAALAGQERFSGRRALGVAISLAGVLPLVVGGTQLFGPYALGNALMVLNCLCFSLYLVLAKSLRHRYPALVLIAWNYLMSVPFLPLFLWGHTLAPADPTHPGMWLSLAFVVVFPTILGYLLNMFALGRLRASTTATYIYLQPLIAALSGHLILGERVTPAILIAAAPLFAGLWLVSREGTGAS